MIAAGKGWHAGRGYWQGITDGNAHLIGIEAENTGDSRDPWPQVQMDAYKRGCAAILKHIGAGPIMCAGHKEYALPHGRKDDPSFDMVMFRKDVAKLMIGWVPPSQPIPAPLKPVPAPIKPIPRPSPDPFETAARAVDPDAT